MVLDWQERIIDLFVESRQEEVIGSFKYARVEYERCFLLREIPADLGGDFFRITDVYIIGTRIRLRRMERPDGEFVIGKLGQKYQGEGQTEYERMMTSIYLNEGEYAVFADMAGETIVKRRYPYPFKGQKYSVDVFEGDLAGLVLCDVEGETLAQIREVKTLSFAVKEVTEDEFFSGGNLAKMGREAFEAWLENLR